MALATGEYRSGGRVFDSDGRRVVKMSSQALTGTLYKSGGKYYDADGYRVIVRGN